MFSGCVWNEFGIYLASFWDMFGIVFGPFFIIFKIVPKSLRSSIVLAQFKIIFWYISYYKLSAIEYVGLIISAGISSGAFGITVAHELIHQRYFERILSRIILFTVCYPHFCIEHVHGHHINVGTPKDPASARIGQNVYNFLFLQLFHQNY